MKLIALSGKARSGKDTVGLILKLADAWEQSDYLKVRYNNKAEYIRKCLLTDPKVSESISTYRTVAFADKLKYVVALIFNSVTILSALSISSLGRVGRFPVISLNIGYSNISCISNGFPLTTSPSFILLVS